MRRRLDAELVRRGLAESREQAQRSIDERRVRVSGAIAEKAARLVDPGEPVELVGDGPRYVSRGGEKLHAALARFVIEANGVDAFDAGASTGGFTDCLLRHGARSVVAADVGHGQLHPRIRNDERVEVHERVNLRTVQPTVHFGGRRFALVVGDLSFISLTSLADNLLALAAPGASLILLVKPQFEAGRVEVARGRGVIDQPEIWARTFTTIADAFAARGAAMIDAMVSPITGTDGNVEFLAHLRAPSEHGILEQGTLEQGTLEQGTLEQGTLEQGTLEHGAPDTATARALIGAAVESAVTRRSSRTAAALEPSP